MKKHDTFLTREKYEIKIMLSYRNTKGQKNNAVDSWERQKLYLNKILK